MGPESRTARRARRFGSAIVAASLAPTLLLACTAIPPAGSATGPAAGTAVSEGTGPSEPSPARASEVVAERPQEMQFPTETEGLIEIRAYRLLRPDGFSAYVPKSWTSVPMPPDSSGEGAWVVNGPERPIQAISAEWLPASTTESQARAAFEAAANPAGSRVYASEAPPSYAPWALRLAVREDRHPALPAWEYTTVYLVRHGGRYLLLRSGSVGDGLDGLAAVSSVFLHSWRWADDGSPLIPGDHPGLRRLVGLGWSFEYPEAWTAAGGDVVPSGGAAAHVFDPVTGDGLAFVSRAATPGEVERYVNAEVGGKLGGSECDESLVAPPVSESQGGVNVYRYAVRSHCGDTAEAVLYDAVFFDGRTMVELRTLGRVPAATFEAIASSFRFER